MKNNPFLKVFEVLRNFFQKVSERVKGRALAHPLPDKPQFFAPAESYYFIFVDVISNKRNARNDSLISSAFEHLKFGLRIKRALAVTLLREGKNRVCGILGHCDKSDDGCFVKAHFFAEC